MSTVAVLDETVSFGPAVAPEINLRLQMAVQARTRDPQEAERLLWEAQRKDPACLPVYFAMYKFYANAKRFEEAQNAARLALAEAARQAGFSADWAALTDEPLYESEAGLFYLFSLKALSFITLRRGSKDEATTLLAHLHRLDPEDRSGGSVIRALAESLES